MFRRVPPWPASGGPPVEREYNVSTRDLAQYQYMGNPTIHRDIQEIEDRGPGIVSERQKARAQHLAEDENFLEWLTREEPGCLLVQGDCNQASQVSGLSLFCTTLRRVLLEHGSRFIPLAFFCGLQTGPPERPPTYDDARRNAPPGYNEDQPPAYNQIIEHAPGTSGCSMIRSLVYQLLRRLPGVLIPMRPTELQHIRSGNTDALCILFSRLLRRFDPGVTVWCLIDGVEHFEQNGDWNDTDEVLEWLRCLSIPDAHNTGASVSLLLTTPRFMTRMRPFPQRSQTIWLPQRSRGHTGGNSGDLQRILQNIVNQAHGQPETPPR